MKQIYIFALIACFCTACTSEPKINIIKVTDHGITPNTKQSITSKINKLIENLNDEAVTIVFPKGRYDFYPDSSYMAFVCKIFDDIIGAFVISKDVNLDYYKSHFHI